MCQDEFLAKISGIMVPGTAMSPGGVLETREVLKG
jgi:hypothetical protein